MGEIFYQFIILAGSGYIFYIIVKFAGDKTIAELIKYATILSAVYYIIVLIITAAGILNEKIDNWLRIF